MSILGETLDRLLERKPRPVRAVHQKACLQRTTSSATSPNHYGTALLRGEERCSYRPPPGPKAPTAPQNGAGAAARLGGSAA